MQVNVEVEGDDKDALANALKEVARQVQDGYTKGSVEGATMSFDFEVSGEPEGQE